MSAVPRPRDVWRLVVGTSLSLALLWLATRGVAWRAVVEILAGSQPGFVLLAAASAMAATALRAWCWQRIVGAGAERVGFPRMWAMVLMGQTLNIVVLTRLGDLVRAYLIKDAAGLPAARAASTIVVEKILDASTFLLFLVPIPMLLSLPAAVERARTTIAISTTLVVVAALVLVRSSDRIASFFETRLSQRFETGAAIAGQVRAGTQSFDVLRRWRRAVPLQLVFILVWSVAALANYFAFRALALPVPPVAAIVVLVVLQLGTAVPSAPGRIGVFQYLCLLALQPFGVDQSHALTYGILLHGVTYGPPVVAGTICLWWALPRLRQDWG